MNFSQTEHICLTIIIQASNNITSTPEASHYTHLKQHKLVLPSFEFDISVIMYCVTLLPSFTQYYV